MKDREKRTECLIIMLSDTEKKQISEMANTRGMTMSAYCRMVMLDSVNKEKEDGDE